MNRLRAAVEARTPIITCRTTDTLNIFEYLSWISGKTCEILARAPAAAHEFDDERIYAVLGGDVDDADEVYAELDKSGATLVVVNPDSDEIPMTFGAGRVDYERGFLLDVLKDFPNLKSVAGMLEGFTPTEAKIILKMCIVDAGKVDVHAVQKFRNVVDGYQSGLYLMPDFDEFHVPDPRIEKWIVFNGKFLVDKDIPELRPRGLLLTGAPGTGKTQSSKYIAARLGVSLFRLEIGSLLSKWVGESEANLLACLSRIDANAPCVVLVDEVEKLFNREDDDGISQRLLSQLLWWLQDHDSAVLTVMTTNNAAKLPRELYRRGRVDAVIEFKGFSTGKDVLGFVESMIAHLLNKYGERLRVPTAKEVTASMEKRFGSGYVLCTPAEITQMLVTVLKKKNI